MMLRFFACLLFFSVAISASAQVECLNPTQRLGLIERDTPRVVDLVFINKGSEKAFLLNYKFPREYAVLPAKRELQQGDTCVIRFKFNPAKKGRYSETIPVSFSSQNDPIQIKVTADVQFIDRTENPACPSFDEQAMASSDQKLITFEVLDARSGLPIRNAQIRTIEQGELAGKYRTDRKGLVQEAIPIGYYYILSEAEGYTPADSSSYLNKRNNYFRFFLEPLAEEVLPEPEITEEIVLLPPPASEPIPEPEIAEEITVPATDPFPSFSEKDYAANNIVFLIDVSGSMANKGKMDLLKASMISLLELLRPIDKVTILTYASKVKTVLPTTSAANKEEIKAIIKSLEARGSTSGASAVKQAFKKAKLAQIAGGNNQVIIATDGAFRQADNPVIEKTVKKYQRRNIDLSVVGIRSSSSIGSKLAQLAILGDGAYLQIEDFDQAGAVLVAEIRNKSRRR